MKKTLKHLNSQEWFEADDFYAITIYIGSVVLQGHYSHEAIKKYSNAGFIFEINPRTKHIETCEERDGFKYRIALT